MQSLLVCLKQLLNREIIFHLKSIGTEKHMWTSGFYSYECMCTDRKQEFQNILERKLYNCFGQLLFAKM